MMKQLMIIYDTGAESLVNEALERSGVTAWTKFTDCYGRGRSGTRMGDPIFPGLNDVTMTVVDADMVPAIKAELEKIPSEFIKELAFRVIISDVEVLI